MSLNARVLKQRPPWLVNAGLLFLGAISLFSAGRASGWQSLYLAGAVVCVLGSVCLAVGSVVMDARIRARKCIAAASGRQA